MKWIVDSQDLNSRLHRLYQNRELLSFTYGSEYFDQQVLSVWREWIKTTRVAARPGSIQEKLNEYDTPEFNKGCWELDNGYEETV